MTNSEFKAWFEGFSEGIDETPSAKQWKKIQEKIKSLDGQSSVHHYYHGYAGMHPRPYYGPYWYPYMNAMSGVAAGSAVEMVQNNSIQGAMGALQSGNFAQANMANMMAANKTAQATSDYIDKNYKSETIDIEAIMREAGRKDSLN